MMKRSTQKCGLPHVRHASAWSRSKFETQKYIFEAYSSHEAFFRATSRVVWIVTLAIANHAVCLKIREKFRLIFIAIIDFSHVLFCGFGLIKNLNCSNLRMFLGTTRLLMTTSPPVLLALNAVQHMLQLEGTLVSKHLSFKRLQVFFVIGFCSNMFHLILDFQFCKHL